MRALFSFVCAGCGACLAALPVGSPIGPLIRLTAPLWFIGATAPLWFIGATAPLWFIGATAPLRLASSSSG